MSDWPTCTACGAGARAVSRALAENVAHGTSNPATLAAYAEGAPHPDWGHKSDGAIFCNFRCALRFAGAAFASGFRMGKP